MDLSLVVESKLMKILKKLKMMDAVKSYKLKIDWGQKRDVAKANRYLVELNDALTKFLLKILSKPRRAEIRNVISELVKKKNDVDSSSDASVRSGNDSVNSSDFESPRIRRNRPKKLGLDGREKPKKATNEVEAIPNSSFNCGVCASLFKTKEELKNHKSIHDEETFLCEYCGKQFHQISAWKYHLLNVHNQNKKVKCEKCFAWFSTDLKLRSHGKVHEDTKFRCEICLKCFSALKTLESHKLTHREKAHECPSCFEKFETKVRLNIHLKNDHETKRNLKCRRCRLSFKSKPELQNHIKEEHKRGKDDRPSSEAEHVCLHSSCGRTFRHRRSLRNHEASVHRSGKEAFSCGVCLKSFIEKGKFNRHLASHQEGKFACTLCSKDFSRKDALKRHVVVSHEGTKSFSCKFCDKTFSLKYNRDVHEDNVHGNEDTNIECEICGKKCKNKTTFTIHKKTHSEKKLSCSFCKKIFIRKANYHFHMKKKHPGISPFQTLLDSVVEAKD